MDNRRYAVSCRWSQWLALTGLAALLVACGGGGTTSNETDGGVDGGSDAGTTGGGDGGIHGGSDGGSDGGTNGGTDGGITGLTANQKKVAEALTSIWENDTPAHRLRVLGEHPGRPGLHERARGLLHRHRRRDPGHPVLRERCGAPPTATCMAKYMPGLTTINDRFNSTGQDQASTAELDSVGNWPADWAASYNTTTTRADFKSCQDQISDQLYYTPAMNTAAKWGLTQALTKAALYDAFINHGEDGAKALITPANTALGDSAQVAPVIGYNGITENAWLQKFLEKRRDMLAADSTWIDAMDRVATYEKLRRLGNWDFSTAVRNDVRARDCWTTTYPSSGYTVRTVNPDGTWSTPASSTYSCN